MLPSWEKVEQVPNLPLLLERLFQALNPAVELALALGRWHED
jgi:hypothetical protein